MWVSQQVCKPVHQSVDRQVCRSVVVSQVQTDLALLGKLVDDLRFKVGAVDTSLPEGSSIAILLPVMMPVPLLVCTVTEHRHLNTDRKWCHDTLQHKQIWHAVLSLNTSCICTLDSDMWRLDSDTLWWWSLSFCLFCSHGVMMHLRTQNVWKILPVRVSLNAPILRQK